MQVEDDLAARRLQRRPSRDFFLADESWEGIFCGVVIPDRGMITYSTFIVGIPIVTMPIRSFFKGSILIPSLLLNPHAIKSLERTPTCTHRARGMNLRTSLNRNPSILRVILEPQWT